MSGVIILLTQTSCTIFSGKVFKITKHLRCSTHPPPKKKHRWFHDFWEIPPEFFQTPLKKSSHKSPTTNQPTIHSFLASSSKSSGTLGALPQIFSGLSPLNFETSWRGACYFFTPRPQGTKFDEKFLYKKEVLRWIDCQSENLSKFKLLKPHPKKVEFPSQNPVQNPLFLMRPLFLQPEKGGICGTFW